jgi:hypothetical protein
VGLGVFEFLKYFRFNLNANELTVTVEIEFLPAVKDGTGVGGEFVDFYRVL